MKLWNQGEIYHVSFWNYKSITSMVKSQISNGYRYVYFTAPLPLFEMLGFLLTNNLFTICLNLFDNFQNLYYPFGLKSNFSGGEGWRNVSPAPRASNFGIFILEWKNKQCLFIIARWYWWRRNWRHF